jgi:hypothetical protein
VKTRLRPGNPAFFHKAEKEYDICAEILCQNARATDYMDDRVRQSSGDGEGQGVVSSFDTTLVNGSFTSISATSIGHSKEQPLLDKSEFFRGSHFFVPPDTDFVPLDGNQTIL